MPTNRRSYLKTGGTALLGAAALTGCLEAPTGSGDDTLNLAIISSSAGFGDKAFNDMALKGLMNAKEKFGATVQKVEETSPSQFGTTQARLAESTNPDYDLIVLVGYGHTQPLKENAEKYPDQKWMLINAVVDEPNVAGFIWANHQMSFQAGVLAGTMTTREFSYKGSSTTPDGKIVGFVGGKDVSLIRAFERAYVKGVHHIDPEVEVKIGYAGSYSAPQKGRQVAASQYDSGADIVYHAAAATGRGVFQAAQNKGRFAIGVDADQSKTLPQYKDVIMGSAVKFINRGTFRCAKAVYNDTWESVRGKNVLGLDDDAVKLVLGQAIGPKLPDIVRENLDASRQAIINGEISVPCSASGCK